MLARSEHRFVGRHRRIIYRLGGATVDFDSDGSHQRHRFPEDGIHNFFKKGSNGKRVPQTAN